MKRTDVNKNRSYVNRWWRLSLVWVISVWLLASPGPALAKSGLKVKKITVGEDTIQTNRKQLIEVLVENATNKDEVIVVKLLITMPNQLIITHGAKKAVVKAKTDTRVLMSYPVNRKRVGDYTVAARLYSRRGRLQASSGKRLNVDFFAVDKGGRKKVPRRPRRSRVKKKAVKSDTAKIVSRTLQFDPPDLLFRDVDIINNTSILRGETAHIRLTLTNNGGDVAEGVEYSVYWYFVHRQNRKMKLKIPNSRFKIIAPGENKIIQLPLTIPEDEQKGEYYVLAEVDQANYLKESNEDNNGAVSSQPIIFSDIALMFPEESHSFAEDGRFIFQWRSKKFNQFKVQISADEFFLNLEKTFELPKGSKWESAKTIKPLVGELPTMALALMNSNDMDYLYWRVRARNSQGDTAESAGRKFFINLKANSK